MTGLFTNTAGALAVARGGRQGGSGPRIGAGDPGDEPGRSGARGARVGGVNLETRWPRLFQLSSGGLGLSGWGARVGVPGVCCPRCRWVSAGDTGSRGAALGAPPSRLLGDWPPSRLRGALGRPRAEVTAAEFLPGRFPAPPQRLPSALAKEVGASSLLPDGIKGPLQRVSLGKWVWRGSPDLALLQVHPPWPLTSSGYLYPKW